MKKYFIFLFSFFCFSVIVLGSNDPIQKKIDSLTLIFQTTNNKFKQVDILHLISELEHQKGDLDKSYAYALQTDELAKSINYNVGRARTLLKLGILEREKRDLQAALGYFKETLVLARKAGDLEVEGEVFTNIGYIYEMQNDLDKSLYSHLKALEVYRKTKNKKKIGVSCSNVAENYSSQRNYIKSIAYYEEAYLIFSKEGDDDWRIAYTAANLGEQYRVLGQDSNALKYYYIALEYYIKSNNLEGVSWAYILIGNVYSKTDEFKKTLEYYEKALQISKQLERRADIKNINNSIGGYFFSRNRLDEALQYYNKVQKMAEEDDDLFWLCLIHNFIGQTKALQGNFDEALEHLNISHQLSIENKQIKTEYANIRWKAFIYSKQKKYDLAKEYIEKSIEYHLETKEKNPLFRDYELLSEINENMGNYPAALENYKLYKIYADSLKADNATKVAMQYEFEKKETENEIKKNEEIRQKTIVANTVYSILGGLILVAIVVIYIFRLRNKKLLAEKQNLEIKRREAELAKETEEFKARFLSNISHEFRTPLTLINGHLEILKKEENSKNIQRFQEMEYSGKRLLQLINQLLDLTKIETGAYKLYYKKGNLLNEAQNYAQAFHSLAEQRKINLFMQITDAAQNKLQSQNFAYSSEALASIINNLIGNALKFTPEGKKVCCTLDFVLDKLYISVKDEGLGIPEKDLSTIFNRFYQIQSEEKPIYEGSGIGLAIVKELAQLHGGDVAVENNPEGGCTFTVSLAEGKITANSRENSPELILSPENPEENSQNEKEEEKTLILVVEDQRELRKFIVENLGDDFRFLEAENGKTGIEMAIAHVPEIIISDVMMPEINGFQLTKTIKENEITSHIPILLLTAKVEQADVIEGLTVGADDYLVKPFSISELELRIKNRLKQQENLRKKFNQNPYLPKEEETEKLNLIDRNFIEKLDRIVREHIENEIDVSFLSSEIGLSNSQLTRKLKVLIGVTPANFIKNIHLNYALDLLRDGYSVSEASWKSGFSDPAYFSKVFKKHFGFLPSDKEQF